MVIAATVHAATNPWLLLHLLPVKQPPQVLVWDCGVSRHWELMEHGRFAEPMGLVLRALPCPHSPPVHRGAAQTPALGQTTPVLPRDRGTAGALSKSFVE